MMIIGIDPDLRKSGWCALDGGKITELESLTFCEILERIQCKPAFYSSCKFAIEDVNQNKAVYSRKTSPAAKSKIAQNVGQVKAACTLLQELIFYCTGESCILVPPGIGKQVKKNAKLFKDLTGWDKPTNEDKRDAWAIARYAETIC